MKPYQTTFRDHAIKSGALKTGKGEFTLKSGRVADYFFNIAEAMKSGKGLSVVSRCYADMIQESFDGGHDCDFLLGPAYKGIPLAATIAQELSNRGINKRYGFAFKESVPLSISTEDIISSIDGIDVVDSIELEGIPSDGDHARDFAKHYAQEISKLDFDSALSEAYGGIVYASIILKELFESQGKNKRWAYNRRQEKEYGDKSEVKLVGDLKKGDKVLLLKTKQELKPGEIWKPEKSIPNDYTRVQLWKYVIGDLRDGDRVSETEDVITTGDTKIEAWKFMTQEKTNLHPAYIYLGLDRQETTKDGRSPIKVVEDAGWGVKSILEARPTFVSLHNKEVGGEVLLDDDTLLGFIDYQAKYGT